MASSLKNLTLIHNNPFILAPVLVAFFEAYGARERNLLLSYLVLPLVLNPVSGKVLSNARPNTSLATFSAQRQRIFGLQDRVVYYKKLTNSCIQLAIDSGALTVAPLASVRLGQTSLNDEASPFRSLPAARKLGEICAPFEIPAVFRMLGIKNL